MRTLATLGAVGVLAMLAGCARDARTQPVVLGPGGPPPGAYYQETTVPAGTQLWVTLDSAISPRSAPGDTFTGHIEDDIRGQGGEVLVPSGAVVTGTIDEIRPGYGDAPMAVRLDVRDIEMAGVRQPLQGAIVGADVQGRSVRGRDVAIGAGAGALLGAILEGGKGALVGGAVGAGAGALISLGRSGQGPNELPRGSKLAVELQAPIRTLASLQGGGRYY